MTSGERTDRVSTAAQELWCTAQEQPSDTALTDLDHPGGRVDLTYAQLRDEVASVAGALRELGLLEGDRVALLLHNSVAYVKTYLAVVAAGMVVVPLNVRLLASDYRHMLNDSGAKVLVTTGDFLRSLPELTATNAKVVRVDHTDGPEPELDVLARWANAIRTPVNRPGDSPASFMYTSGTTGLPKAVVLSDRAWEVIADRAINVLNMRDSEVILHAAPLTHGAGFLLLPTIRCGGHNLLCASYDGARTVELIEEFGVTGTFLVPSMIRMLLDAWTPGRPVPATLRRIYYAGSPIDPDTFREATNVFAGRLVQSFAQMESPMFFAVLTEDDHRRAAAMPDSALVRSAGRVLPGVELRIVDQEGRRVETGSPGEIIARAPQTMNGYWNRPDSTEKTLVNGWLYTGDIGYLDGEGYLYVVDRTKDMIVTGGSNVYAREVEEVLLNLPSVQEAAVVGTPHRIWGEAVTAVLVPKGERPDDDAVLAACRAELAGYRVPKRIEWVEELPRNAYGKVLKRALRDQLAIDG